MLNENSRSNTSFCCFDMKYMQPTKHFRIILLDDKTTTTTSTTITLDPWAIFEFYISHTQNLVLSPGGIPTTKCKTKRPQTHTHTRGLKTHDVDDTTTTTTTENSPQEGISNKDILDKTGISINELKWLAWDESQIKKVTFVMLGVYCRWFYF